MFNSLDPLHSYDPLEILKLIYRLIFGGTGNAADWGTRGHDALIAFFQALPFFFINVFARFIVFSFFLSIALIVLLVVYIRRYKQMKEKIMSKVLPAHGKENRSLGEEISNPKWKIVLRDIDSSDPGKWKLAILEADIILGELLDTLSLPGDGIGEKLKAIEKSDFEHLDQAWEAHKIRNAIAHGGSDFLLTQREAKRVVGLYEEVFNEFEII